MAELKQCSYNLYAGMAELADALDSGSSEGNFMQVQFLLPAPQTESAHQADGRIFPVFTGTFWYCDSALQYVIAT